MRRAFGRSASVRLRPFAVSVLAGLALGACGEETPSGTGPGPPRPPERAQLRLTPRVVQPGGALRATLVAAPGTPVEGGIAYRLEARRAGGWRWLNRDDAFIQIAIGATHERPYSQVIRVPRDVRSGRHRIVKELRVAGTGERVDVAAEFEVRG